MSSLEKLTWSKAVSIWAPRVLKTLLEIRNGVLEFTMQIYTNHLASGTRIAREHATVLLLPKRKIVLHGTSRTLERIFSGK